MRRNVQLLLGLYCITLLHNVVPTSANPNTGSSVTQTINTVPRPAQHSDHSYRKPGLTDALFSRAPTGDRSIKKRSAEALEFPDFPVPIHENRINKITYECKYAGICNRQWYDDTNPQISNQLPDNQEEYGKPNYNEVNLVSPYLRSLAPKTYPDGEGSEVDSDMYYPLPALEDSKRILDSNEDDLAENSERQYTPQVPKVIILALRKPQLPELTNKYALEDRDGLQQARKVKKNIFTSRGWGAGGMPFSVLYMHQQQHMKPASRSAIAGAQQLVAPQPLRGYPPTASQYRQVAVRNALSSALTAGNNGGGGSTSLPTRRQYSIIPQLYVSYGWGPHGK